MLLAAVVLAARLGHFQRWEGFQEKSTSVQNMNSTLKFFIETYNNASNDTYLFQVDKLLRSQMQVCASVSLDMGSAHLGMWGHGMAPRENQVMVSPRQGEASLRMSMLCSCLDPRTALAMLLKCQPEDWNETLSLLV